MPSTTQQTTSISVVASGRMVFGWINIGFVLSLLGGLQFAVVVFDLILVSILGYTVSYENGSNHFMSGFTFYVFLFLVSFWCLMTSGLMYISSVFSMATSSLLPRTIFFSVYHAFALVFFVSSSVSALGQAGKYSHIYVYTGSTSDVKSTVYAAAGIGLFVTVLYGLLLLVGIYSYRKSKVDSPS